MRDQAELQSMLSEQANEVLVAPLSTYVIEADKAWKTHYQIGTDLLKKVKEARSNVKKSQRELENCKKAGLESLDGKKAEAFLKVSNLKMTYSFIIAKSIERAHVGRTTQRK